MKNHITHLRSGSKSENHDKWLVAFYEKNNILVGLITNEYLNNNDEIEDLDEKIGDKKSEQLIFDSLLSILPDKNLIISVIANGFSWLKDKKQSFFRKLMSRDSNSEFKNNLSKDGLDLLSLDVEDNAVIKLKDKIGLLPKYFENLGFYEVAYDRDWVFVPKKEVNNKDEFNELVNFPLLNKLMFGSVKKVTDSEWKELYTNLDEFHIIGFLHHKSFHFVTKELNMNQIISKLKPIAEKFDLKIAEDHIIS